MAPTSRARPHLCLDSARRIVRPGTGSSIPTNSPAADRRTPAGAPTRPSHRWRSTAIPPCPRTDLAASTACWTRQSRSRPFQKRQYTTKFRPRVATTSTETRATAATKRLTLIV